MAHFDVVVIGGGTAGSNAARTASTAGAQTALIRNPVLANTCVDVGCMPSKAVLAAAADGLPLASAVAHGTAVSERLEESLSAALEREDYEIYWGTARFTDSHTVVVTNHDGEHTLTADRIVIATGATAFVPNIPGLTDLTFPQRLLSDDVVGIHATLRERPARLLVLGAGPIGLELATFFDRLGSDVLVLERNPQVLRLMDPEFGSERQRLADAGYSFRIAPAAELVHIGPTETALVATLERNGTREQTFVDAILVATGRRPHLTGLNLEAAGLTPDERGRIAHDRETLQSEEQSHIYLAGDVTGHHQILHMGAAMGRTAGANAAHGTPREWIDFQPLSLAVIFEEFESAVLGYTEADALEAGLDVVTAARDLADVGRGITDRLPGGHMKLIAERSSGRILGAQLLGPHAGEIIQILGPALYNENTAADLLAMPFWYHPTFGELWHSLAKDIEAQRST